MFGDIKVDILKVQITIAAQDPVEPEVPEQPETTNQWFLASDGQSKINQLRIVINLSYSLRD